MRALRGTKAATSDGSPEHRSAPPPYGEQHVPPIKGIFESGFSTPRSATDLLPSVSRRRLQTAKAKLAAGCGSLSEIALDCQFSSQSSFNRAFRKASGMTPAQYRRALR
jgi:Helix-turn-helix domain